MEKIEPGEWQHEPNGKRYRMIGNCKEYEPTINGIPESIFFASKKAEKERQATELEAENKRAATATPPRNCPFASGMRTSCTQESCALYREGCALVRIFGTPQKATEGLQCPLNNKGKCRKDCALFVGNGCILTGLKEREE